jgi:hypothetical protein
MDPRDAIPGARLLGLGLALLLSTAAAVAPQARAASDRLVTFAARYCDDYTDVTANRERNNIQESLRDLGADTLYGAGEAVQPAKEQLGQPDCHPLPDWRFTLGTGHQTRAVVGPWGALARVTNPYDTSIVTLPSVPLLDVFGQDTGQTIAGAITVELTDEQAARTATSSSLWVQGGVPDDPVLDRVFPSEYGFAALRCSLDNLNGDNVEWVTYPTGGRHVFCFAYYVRPPPTSGTIVVRKVVDDPDATAPTDFRYEGNVSYTADHSFTLRASHGTPASETFHRGDTRAGEEPWTFREDPRAGWALTSLDCASRTGESVTLADVETGAVSVRLAAGDTVTCTYVNRLRPPVSGLELSKVTFGDVGRFGFVVDGQNARRSLSLVTQTTGVPVASDAIELPTGTYAVDESLPDRTAAGRWLLDDVTCDGRSRGTSLPLSVTLTAGSGHFCQFANRFEPAGSITIRKRTVGATGTVGFVVFRNDEISFERELRATTRAKRVPVRATGDDLSDLPLGDYTIVETGPAPRRDGEWSVDSVACDGALYPSAQGRIEVRLTAAHPHLDCTYTDRFRAIAEPPTDVTPPNPEEPPGPGPRIGVAGLSKANRPRADLRVTKRVSTPVTTVGSLVRYTIVVVNRGPDTARKLSGVEFGPRARDVVRLRISRGRCFTGRRPIVCRVASLAPGRRVVVRVVVRAGRARRLVNHVAVSTSTADPNLRNNRARAALLIRRTGPGITG